MKKRRVLMTVLTVLFILSAFSLSASNPWRAKLKVINQTGDPVYIILKPSTKDGTHYPQLIATGVAVDEDDDEVITSDKKKQLRDDQTTKFTIDKDIYDAVVIACGMQAVGTMDLTRNLKLNFTECEKMHQYWTPKYPGEPSMEKPNWFRAPGMGDWRFLYEVPTTPVNWAEPGDIE